MRFARLEKRFRRILDRYTGYVVAIPVCGLFLLVLALLESPVPVPRIPPRILIEFNPVEIVQPEPQPPDIDEVILPPEDVAATRIDSQETGDVLRDPVRSDDIAQGIEDSMPSSLQSWIPTTRDAAQLAAIREQVAAQDRFLEQRRTELQKEIIRGEVVSAATDFKLNSDGGLSGAIRTLDLEGFPIDQVIPILQRYGISYERRFTTPVAGRSYLNAAQTSDGTFRHIEKEGYYNVMVLSPMAIAFMAKLEVEGLQERGYDPRNTRVRKIVFGIVKNRYDDFDLGVVDLEVERIR